MDTESLVINTLEDTSVSKLKSKNKPSHNHTTMLNSIKKELLKIASQTPPVVDMQNQEITICLSRLLNKVKKISLDKNVFQSLMAAFKQYPSKIIKSKHYRYKNKTLVAFDDMNHFSYKTGLAVSHDYVLLPTPNQSVPNCLTVTKPNKTPINIYEFDFKVFYNDVKFINTTVYSCDGCVVHFDKIKQVNGLVSHEMRLVTSQTTIKKNIDAIVQVLRTIVSLLKKINNQ